MPKNGTSRLSEESAFIGSAHSFEVCVSSVRPEVAQACASILHSRWERATGAERELLDARMQWWAAVAAAGRRTV